MVYGRVWLRCDKLLYLGRPCGGTAGRARPQDSLGGRAIPTRDHSPKRACRTQLRNLFDRKACHALQNSVSCRQNAVLGPAPRPRLTANGLAQNLLCQEYTVSSWQAVSLLVTPCGFASA